MDYRHHLRRDEETKKLVKGGDALEIIAAVYGGMFSYSEILNLDVRDQAFWLRAARRKTILDQMRSIQAARAGMADEKDYSRVMSDLQQQLFEIDGNEVIRQNWEDLKIMRRG